MKPCMHEPRLHISASFELPVRREVQPPARFPAIAGLIVAALVVISSLAGIGDPATYGRETASWRAQGIGQDWVDLIVAVPWLIGSAIASLRGSHRGSLLLGSGLAYTAYSFVIYAFDVHFNQMFLVYCAILGLSIYGLIALAMTLAGKHLRVGVASPALRRVASVVLLATATLFALMWLGDDVPAVLRDEPPADLRDVGLFTNAVHVLDLALVLPALFASGILFWRRRNAGHMLATIAIGFCVLMNLNIAGIVVALQRSGLAPDLTMAWTFGGVAVVMAVVLGWLLHSSRTRPLQVNHSQTFSWTRSDSPRAHGLQ